jgi:hypothetical protein
MVCVQANGNISLAMVIDLGEKILTFFLLILFNYVIEKNQHDVTNVAHAHILAADELIPGSAIAGNSFRLHTLLVSLFIFISCTSFQLL